MRGCWPLTNHIEICFLDNISSKIHWYHGFHIWGWTCVCVCVCAQISNNSQLPCLNTAHLAKKGMERKDLKKKKKENKFMFTFYTSTSISTEHYLFCNVESGVLRFCSAAFACAHVRNDICVLARREWFVKTHMLGFPSCFWCWNTNCK